MAFPTAGSIVSDAAVELGLVSAAVADPYASSDANMVQLCALLKSIGREIAGVRDWTVQQLEYSFNTVAGTKLYNLPADFRRKIDQSGWNRTSRFPLGGPLSPQEYQYLQAIPAAQTITVLFRPRNGQIELYPVPQSVLSIAFEYLTSFWVAVTGSTTPTKDGPTLSSDVVLFDPLLMVRALKLAWKREKGFESMAAQQDYDAAYTKACDDDAEAPKLRLDGKGGVGFRLIDPFGNIPESGFGQ